MPSAKLHSCVQDLIAQGHAEDSAYAICQKSISETIHSDFQQIQQRFIKQFGIKDGLKLYDSWLQKNELDETLPYAVEVQYFKREGLKESFQWIERATNVLTQDQDAKYYKVRALTANISLNRHDYRDTQKLMMAAKSLGWRPINLNHDHSQWLPFPEARVHYAKFEDNTVEAIIRIPNTLPNIQHKLDSGEILHPSIEGFPLEGHGKETSEGFDPEEYQFTGLALLEKGAQLPGDPLTTIQPLTESYMIPITESLGKSLIESLQKPTVEQTFNEKLQRHETIDDERTENLTKQLKELKKLGKITLRHVKGTENKYQLVEAAVPEYSVQDLVNIGFKAEDAERLAPILNDFFEKMKQQQNIEDSKKGESELIETVIVKNKNTQIQQLEELAERRRVERDKTAEKFEQLSTKHRLLEQQYDDAKKLVRHLKNCYNEVCEAYLEVQETIKQVNNRVLSIEGTSIKIRLPEPKIEVKKLE